MPKLIDLMDIRKFCKDGIFKAFVNEYGDILLKDVQSGECVKIGDINNE